MRKVDSAPIEAALASLHDARRHNADAFHELESLRDRLLESGPPAIEEVLQRWPSADRQQLRQLLLQHQREQKQGKPPAASRRLFKYLRELQQGD